MVGKREANWVCGAGRTGRKISCLWKLQVIGWLVGGDETLRAAVARLVPVLIAGMCTGTAHFAVVNPTICACIRVLALVVS